jgi:hypothetical protein
MRVRISFSVELEDVPLEVSRLLDQVGHDSEVITDEVNSLISDIESGSIDAHRTKVTIEGLRQKLAKMDLVLSDSDLIMQGYHQATTEPEKPEERDSVSEG